jgi:hypothetical protein
MPGNPGYMERAASNSLEERTRRADALASVAKPFEAACQAMQSLHQIQRVRTVNVRLPYIGPADILQETRTTPQTSLSPEPDPEHGRPPLAGLVGRRTESLRLHLVLLAAAQLLVSPGYSPTDLENRIEDEGTTLRILLAMSHVPARTSTLRLQRAMRGLEAAGLLSIPRHRTGTGDAGVLRNYRKARLLSEVGSGKVYSSATAKYSDPSRAAVPGGCLGIPPVFFTNGWHLVLSGPELATYLMLRHATAIGLEDKRHIATFKSFGPTMLRPIVIYRSTRVERYGVSDEVYTAHRTLAEFGLIYRGQRPGSGRRGRTSGRPSGHRFLLRDEGLLRPAAEVALEALRSGEAPHLRRSDETAAFVVERLTPATRSRARAGRPVRAELEPEAHDVDHWSSEDVRLVQLGAPANSVESVEDLDQETLSIIQQELQWMREEGDL